MGPTERAVRKHCQTANQAQQIENQVRQITGVYTQVDQGIRNLARLDIDNITDLYGMLNQLQSKLSQAEYIGYAVDRAWHQAQGLYPRVYGVLTGPQQRELTLLWAAMRRNSAQVAISTQAIRDAQARYQHQWADLIRARAGGRRQRASAASAGPGPGDGRASS